MKKDIETITIWDPFPKNTCAEGMDLGPDSIDSRPPLEISEGSGASTSYNTLKFHTLHFWYMFEAKFDMFQCFGVNSTI